MVVTAEHYGAYFAVSDHLVELQCNLESAHGILIENASLCAYNESIFLCIANPVVVIAVLSSAIGVDAFHGCLVGLHEVFVLAAQANPAERAISIVKQHRAHDVFHIRWPYETIFFVDSVAGNLFHAGIVDGFHERVAIVEEICAAGGEGFDCLEMAAERFVNFFAEFVMIFMEKASALLE